jgi:23S rRNA (adenine2503-C2)-methyltransferase
MPSRIDLLTFDAEDLGNFLIGFGWPGYRTEQVLRWLYQRLATDPKSMTDLSKSDRTSLADCVFISSLVPSMVQEAVDGTKKFIFSLDDGMSIESVLIPENRRLTLCLSTQVGCTLDCGFCLTGRMGLLRNLKAHEIVGQLLAVQRHLSEQDPTGVDSLSPRLRVTNLVFMGMGEPLANLDAVEEAVRRLTNTTWGCGFSPRRITLSTAGLATRIKHVADMGINLAVSLNATTNTQRQRLMPNATRAASLTNVLKACRDFPRRPHRHLTFEYVLLSGENDSDQDARRLITLVRGISDKINLIPFNEAPGSLFRRPSDQQVERFQSLLRHGGLQVFIRKSKGRDILGACGQLGGLVLLEPLPQSARAAS